AGTSTGQRAAVRDRGTQHRGGGVMRVQIRELDAPNPRTVIVTLPDPDHMCGHVWERHLRTVVVPEHFAQPFTVEVAVVEARNLLWLGRTVRIASEDAWLG